VSHWDDGCQPKGRQMTSTWGVTTAAVCAGAAIVAAGAAYADNTLSGTYALIDDNNGAKQLSTWTLSPCGPGCTHVASNHGGTDDAHLSGGQWVVVFDDRPDAVTCPSGHIARGTFHFSFDAVTLAGSAYSSTSVGACGDPPMNYPPWAFHLSKIG
jgi:hypothetical protein